LSAIDQTAQSILSHDWRQTEALVTAMNTPLVLVRGDIVTPYEGRPIVSPAALADALTVSPNFSLVRKTGLLDLFELKSATSDPETTRSIMTINSNAPDLRLLSLLSPHTSLISQKPRAGLANATQIPSLGGWSIHSGAFVWQASLPSNSTHQIVDLDRGLHATWTALRNSTWVP